MTTAVTPARAAARIVAEGLKVGLNLAKPVPCQVRDAECQKQAAWRWRHCCATRNLCQEHHDSQKHRIERLYFAHPGSTWTCSDCGTHPMPDPTYHPI
jgi:hypothetical protein